MTLLERIKATIFGELPPSPPRTVDEDNDNFRTHGRPGSEDWRPEVSTPLDDPVMDEIAASGVQPVSKPVEIEEAQNPRRRPMGRSD